MRAVGMYALGSALLLAVLATAVVALFDGADRGAVWLAAGVAYAVQLVAFVGLVAARKREMGLVAGWGAGMLLRFVALAGVAVRVTVGDGYDPASALLSLVGFMMVLALFEPLSLRWAD